jgi:hypothetical protein
MRHYQFTPRVAVFASSRRFYFMKAETALSGKDVYLSGVLSW